MFTVGGTSSVRCRLLRQEEHSPNSTVSQINVVHHLIT